MFTFIGFKLYEVTARFVTLRVLRRSSKGRCQLCEFRKVTTTYYYREKAQGDPKLPALICKLETCNVCDPGFDMSATASPWPRQALKQRKRVRLHLSEGKNFHAA